MNSNDAVHAQRREIEAAIEGKTVPALLAEIAEQRPDSPAFFGEHRSWTWSQVREQARDLAAGFAALGVHGGDAVALMATNRPEHVLADLGAATAGAVTTTVYSTLAAEQIRHVALDSGARAAVIEGVDALERWQKILGDLPELSVLVLLGDIDPGTRPEGFTGRAVHWDELVELGRTRRGEGAAINAPVHPEDTAVLIYTSGTTGRSKGVELSHRALLYEVEALKRYSGLPDEMISLSYLPLAHVAERVLSVYLPLLCGGQTHFCPDLKKLPEMLSRVRPTIFFGVPQVWERFRSGIEASMAAAPAFKRRLAGWALRAGTSGSGTSAWLANRLVLRRIPAALGLDRCALRAVGAAPLPPHLERFFDGLGLGLTGVYGLSETCGAAVVHGASDVRRPGTVGSAMPGIELDVAEDGEVLVRGPLCTSGYRNLPSATRELFTEDGWLRTGDLGSLDADGLLRITGRKKELIITAGGKNISPTAVESLLVEHPLVGHAMVHGDGRRHLVALLVLDPEALDRWCAANGLPRDGVHDQPALAAEIDRAVAAANSRLAEVEQVRGHVVLPREWNEESGELTPTRKIKRQVIAERYREQLEELHDP